MEDNQLRLKQETIKAEIIDKNYDSNKFLSFCLSKKEHGDDLSNWGVLELNQAIGEFIKAQSSDKQPEKFKEEINVDISQLKICKTIGDETKYDKEVQCKKLERTVLNDKEIIVVLKNPKSSDSTLLQNSFVTYEVMTEAQQWLVRRRFSDFEWLRSILSKCFPRLLVPPLPGKKIGARRFEQDFIEKRMSFLQRFIDSVMIDESFKTSEALVAFLSMIDRGQFDSKMKEMTTYQPSPYVEDSKTLSGKITVIDDEDNERYYTNISNYFKLQTQLFDRLNYNFKNFYVNINAASGNLEEIEKDFETLHLLNNKVQMKEEVSKTYEELGVFFKNWKRILFNQNECIKSHIKDFFKFVRMEGLAYTELIQSREVVKAKYKVEEARVTAKKEKLWSTMDLSKWEIIDEFNKIDRILLCRDKQYAMQKMCTRDSQSLENLHQQLGYANKMNMEELKKMIDVSAVRFVDNMKGFTTEFYPTLSDSINVWSTLNSYL